MAVHLANEIPTIVNYIHTTTGNTSDFYNVIHYQRKFNSPYGVYSTVLSVSA